MHFFYVLLVSALTIALASAQTWQVAQTLEDLNGPSIYRLADVVGADGGDFSGSNRYVVVGRPTAAAGHGDVAVFANTTRGFIADAILRDPRGALGDAFGAAVATFDVGGGAAAIVVAGATAKFGVGAALVFRRRKSGEWDLVATLRPPSNAHVGSFGRTVAFDGKSILVGAEKVGAAGPRFLFSAVRQRGSTLFVQNDGYSDVGCDPLYVFDADALIAGTGTVSMSLRQTLDNCSEALDVGNSIAVSGNTLVVGGSQRLAYRYGHGNDGDLEVRDIVLLDGTQTYNFGDVTIFPGGTLTVTRFDSRSTNGGVLNMNVRGTLTIEAGGSIDVAGRGFPGAPEAFVDLPPRRGSGPGGGSPATSIFTGVLACDYDITGSVLAHVIAERAQQYQLNASLPYAEANGGGGGYGTVGGSGVPVFCGSSAAGGPAYGAADVADALRGSGGGAGFPYRVGSGGAGGNGGGVAVINAAAFINRGTITADGGSGGNGGFYGGGGGGGSGGAIRIVAGTFFNTGIITAVGGQGGNRSIDSGSTPHSGVKGGDGGTGRIRIDVITMIHAGSTTPPALQQTTFGGEVYIYSRSSVQDLWSSPRTLPRLPQMMFIGHAVALTQTTLAVSSAERTGVSPQDEVMILDVSTTIVNGSPSPIVARYFPTQASARFGAALGLSGRTLAIGVPGNATLKGHVVIVASTSSAPFATSTQTVVQGNGAPHMGNEFGASLAVIDGETVIVNARGEVPSSTSRIGRVYRFEVSNNVSRAHSSIICESLRVTAKVPLVCRLKVVDANGKTIDRPYLAAGLVYEGEGLFRFTVTFPAAASRQIGVAVDDNVINSPVITVTGPIQPALATVTCATGPFVSATNVTCTISTNEAGIGETGAEKEFRVVVFALEDITEFPADGTSRSFPSVLDMRGQAVRAPAAEVSVDPATADFAVVETPATFVTTGEYVARVKFARVGWNAVSVSYQGTPIGSPNPLRVYAAPAPPSPSTSTWDCGAWAMPRRQTLCTVTLRAADASITGVKEWEEALRKATADIVAGAGGSASPAVGRRYNATAAYWVGWGRYVVGFWLADVTEAEAVNVVLRTSATVAGVALHNSTTRVGYRRDSMCADYSATASPLQFVAAYQAAAARQNGISPGSTFTAMGDNRCEAPAV